MSQFPSFGLNSNLQSGLGPAGAPSAAPIAGAAAPLGLGLAGLISPALAGAGLGLGVYSLISGMKSASKAKKENKRRYDQMIALLRLQGESARQDIARNSLNNQGAIQQSLIGRGLLNTTILDDLKGAEASRAQRELNDVNSSQASVLGGAINSEKEGGPDTGALVKGVGDAAQQFGGSIAKMLGPSDEDQYSRIRALIRKEDSADRASAWESFPRSSGSASTINGVGYSMPASERFWSKNAQWITR